VVRLIRKWLKAGVAEDGRVTPGEVGTPQGAVISPLLANIYLHYVFDLWAKQWRQRHAQGDVIMVRYADDIVVGFEHQAEAERFWEDMRARLAEFALTLHPGKTRLIEFGRHAAKNRRARGLASRRHSTSLASPTPAGTAGGETSNSVRRQSGWMSYCLA
jgi:retron-type reverse transcriptase